MASSIETTSTTTVLKNNGNTYLSVDTNDVVALTNPLPVASGGTGVTSNAGRVLQVVSATKTDTSSTSSSTFSDVSGLSVAITPSSASSKILVTGHVSVSWDSAVSKVAVRITRNGTAIALGDANGSRIRTTGNFYIPVQSYSTIGIPVNYLDSPSSTSAVTYKCQTSSMDNAGVIYVNRGDTWSDAASTGTSISTITVMEIGA
jgi:hypothetical protein